MTGAENSSGSLHEACRLRSRCVNETQINLWLNPPELLDSSEKGKGTHEVTELRFLASPGRRLGVEIKFLQGRE